MRIEEVCTLVTAAYEDAANRIRESNQSLREDLLGDGVYQQSYAHRNAEEIGLVTVVMEAVAEYKAYVYYNGKLLYIVQSPRDSFWSAVRSRSLPIKEGKFTHAEWEEMEPFGDHLEEAE